jgi:hypothetical protein
VDYDTGPYLAAAFFCERILREIDDTLTAVRIVDSFTVTGVDIPGGIVFQPILIQCLISLKSNVGGRHKLVIRAIGDSKGSDTPTLPYLDTVADVLFGEGLTGSLTTIQLNFVAPLQIGQPRTFWFDVLLDEQLLTRMPLRATYIVATNPETPDEEAAHT